MTVEPKIGTTAKWLDSWPEGATYTFTKAQIETVVAGAKMEARAAALREVAEAAEAVIALVPRATIEPPTQWQRTQQAKIDAAISNLRAALNGASQ